MVTKRLTVRLDDSSVERAKFWAEKTGAGSVNDFVAEAVEEKISRLSGHVPDIDNLHLARLGELIDNLKSMEIRVGNVEAVLTMGMDRLIELARGGNYLLDDVEGDLDD